MCSSVRTEQLQFKRWALSRFKTPDANANAHKSFLFLDKGKVTVTSQVDYDALLETYVRAIRSGGIIRLVEVKSHPTFPFFCDLDFGKCDADTVRHVSIQFARAGLACSGVSSAVLASCFRTSKSGVHIVFPGSRADQQQALAWRDEMLRIVGKEWTDVFDASVFRKGVGLRMLYAAKTGDDAAYVPWFSVTATDVTDIETDMLSSLKLFSVADWTAAIPKPETPSISGALVWTRALTEIGIKAMQHGSVTKVHQVSPNEIRLNTDSRFCVNISRLHHSATVYFIVRKDYGKLYLYQRCHCRCEGVARTFGKSCKHLNALMFPFPLMFSEENRSLFALLDPTL